MDGSVDQSLALSDTIGRDATSLQVPNTGAGMKRKTRERQSDYVILTFIHSLDEDEVSTLFNTIPGKTQLPEDTLLTSHHKRRPLLTLTSTLIRKVTRNTSIPHHLGKHNTLCSYVMLALAAVAWRLTHLSPPKTEQAASKTLAQD